MTGYEHDAQRVKGGVSRRPALVYGPGAANRLIQPPKCYRRSSQSRSLTRSNGMIDQHEPVNCFQYLVLESVLNCALV